MVAALGKPLGGDRITVLRFVAQGEQRLLTPGQSPGLRDGHDVLGREEGLVQAGGRLGERAVVAMVAAQHGERDEDLARVGDRAAVPEISEMGSHPHQVLEGSIPRRQQRFRLGQGQGLAGAGPGQGSTELMGRRHVRSNLRPAIPSRKRRRPRFGFHRGWSER